MPIGYKLLKNTTTYDEQIKHLHIINSKGVKYKDSE